MALKSLFEPGSTWNQSSEMQGFFKTSIGLALAALAWRLFLLVKSGGGLVSLVSPFQLSVTAWVMAPSILLTMLVIRSAYWLIALVPVALIGGLLTYIIATDTSSSTASVSFLFLPLIEWAYIAVVFVVLALLRKVA